MAVYKCFAVFDAAVGAFTSPAITRSRGEAIRAFTDQVNDAKSPFNNHPGDFSLWQLSEWDDSSGLYSSQTALPERVITAVDALTEPRLGASF